MPVNLGSAFGKINIDVSGVTRARKQATEAMGSVQKSFMSIAGPIAVATVAMDVFGKAMGKVGDVLDSLAQGMVGGNKQFEQYETSFKVMLGNADLARQRLEELADFGARTPFELPGVVEADRVLQSFGLHAPAVTEHFKKMDIDIRTLTGDVSAGVGSDFKEIALNIGKFSSGATGEAMARFQELGIATREEMRAMGVEFSKSNALISPLPEAMDALLLIMKDKYGGMMDAQSATMGGMLSNLIDWKNNTLRELGEPIFDILKEKLQSVLKFLDSSAVKGALDEFSGLIKNTLNIVMDFVNSLSGAGITQFVESFTSGLQKVNSFLIELRDRLSGFTAADIMTELAGSIEAVQARVAQSLSDLEANYTRTVTQINAQIESAAEQLNTQLADINERYSEQAAKVSERFAEAQKRTAQQLAEARINYEEQVAQKRQALQEKLENMERQFAEKRRAINEQIQDKIFDYEEARETRKERLEEKLDDMTEKHEENRADLVRQLNAATTDEKRAEIQARIDAEDAEYKKQADKLKAKAEKEEARAKKKHDRAVQKLKDRLAREEKAYQDQVERDKKRAAEEETRLKTKYDRQTTKLNQRLADEEAKRDEQLAKIFAERDAEVAKAQQAHDKQLAMLQDRLAAEQATYEENRAKITTDAEAEIATLEAEAAARAQAISEEATGAMAQVLAVVDGFKEALKKLQPVFDFIKEHWKAIKTSLIAIGAVLAGAGIVAAIAAIASVVATLASPLGLVLGAVALLGVAWGENWGGIQEKTQAVIDFIRPKLQEWWAWIRDVAIPTVKDWANAFVEYLQPKLQEAWDWFLNVALPKIQEWWAWIRDVAIPRIQEWAKVFAEHLKPHLDEIAEKFREFTDDIQPKLKEAWDKMLEVWAAVSQLYNDQLKPALEELAEKLGLNEEGTTRLFEILGDLVGLLLEAQLDQLLFGIDLAVAGLTGSLDILSSMLRGANELIEKFKEAWDTISNLQPPDLNFDFELPDILTPGSPTPFELGLRGIADAINSMPDLGLTFGDLPADLALATAAAPASASTITNNNGHKLTIAGPLVSLTIPDGATAPEIGYQASNQVQQTLRSLGLA